MLDGAGAYRVTFLKWWAFAQLIVGAFIAAWALGGLEALVQNDLTYIAPFILIAFGLMSCWCGREAWALSSVERRLSQGFGGSADAQRLIAIGRVVEFGWFVSETFLALGMIGTIAGFIYTFSSLEGLNLGADGGSQKALTRMTVGISTALYTTLTGLICHVLLRVQLYSIAHSLDRYADWADNQ